ncbi:hypothetical protein BMS3Abin14_00089 [bacterium BMS3Abin14]|nr:hypothetical protein BMS3Abin14_00089 [bacterium BMS3Abin14]
MDFKDHTTLGRTGLSVNRLGIAASYGAPGSAIEAAFHEHGINFLYWGSMRKPGMRDAILNLKGSHRDAEADIFPHIPAENPPGIMSYTATRWGRLLNPKKMPPRENPMTAAECYRFALTRI